MAAHEILKDLRRAKPERDRAGGNWGGGADGAREPFRLLQKQKLNLLFERPCIILYTHIFLDVPLPLMRGE
jgi:hypothetical protein